MENGEMERFSKILNYTILSIPFVYLDIPISANPRRMETWESIINFFDKKLASWKHKHLSFARRVCLIENHLFLFFLFRIRITYLSELA